MDLIALASHAEHWHHEGWWPIFPILWFVLIATAIFFVARRARRGGGFGGYHRSSGESVLGERYARGEISETEYRDRLQVLRSKDS